MTELFSRFRENAEEVTLKLVEKKVDIELEHERQVSLFPIVGNLHFYLSTMDCKRFPTPGLDLQDETAL